MLSFGIGTTTIVIGGSELINLFGFSENTAAMVNLSPYLVSAIALPLIGLLIDRVGRRLIFMLIQTSLAIFGHFYILIHPICKGQCNDVIGIYLIYGLYLTLYILIGWGSIPLFVRENHLSTAYGFLSCFQNIGTTVLPLALNFILDSTKSYKDVEYTFIFILLISLSLKLIIGYWDWKKRGSILMSKNPFISFENYIK